MFDIDYFQSVLNASQTVGSEMGHQLYCLQTLMLNMHEARMNTPADTEDPVITRIHNCFLSMTSSLFNEFNLFKRIKIMKYKVLWCMLSVGLSISLSICLSLSLSICLSGSCRQDRDQTASLGIIQFGTHDYHDERRKPY
jgi:hypothetical protein